MEERFRQITHKGETIILLDLSHLQDEKESIRFLKIRTALQRPHCLLVDLTNTHFSRAILREAKENAKAVRPVLLVGSPA